MNGCTLAAGEGLGGTHYARKAPLGIKIIGIVNFIGWIAGGLIFSAFVLGAAYRCARTRLGGADDVLSIVGILTIIIGFFAFFAFASIQLIRLKKWAWYLFVICQCLGMILAIFMFSGDYNIIISLAALSLNAFLLWYLFTRKALFRPSLAEQSCNEMAACEEESRILGEHLESLEYDLPTLDELEKAIHDDDVTTRLWAIGELERLGNKEALGILEKVVSHEQGEIKTALGEAIERIRRKLLESSD